MAMTSVKVLGLRELGLKMQGLSNEVNLKISRAAVQAGAKIIKDLVVSKAPIAPEPYEIEGVKIQPRNIQRNVVTRRVKDSPLTAETVVAIRGKKKNGFASRVAALQEFGTVKMPPQAFMRPAYDQGKQPAVEAIKKRLTSRIAKAVG